MKKVLTHLRCFMRGLEYNDKEFIDYVKVLDDIIIDMCPITDKFEKKIQQGIHPRIDLILSPIRDIILAQYLL